MRWPDFNADMTLNIIWSKIGLCSLSDTSLSHLMKIAIESPDKLLDSNLEEIVDNVEQKE